MSKNKINYTWDQYHKDICELAFKIEKAKKNYDGLYGIPRGGLIPAKDLSRLLKIPFISDDDSITNKNILVVDDICDSGRTLEEFGGVDTAVLWCDPQSKDVPTFCINMTGDKPGWVTFPWEETFAADAESLVVRQLEMMSEHPGREGLKGTPARVVKMWDEIFRGYDPKLSPKITVFPNDNDGVKVDEMITDTGYFFSHCEHHMVPFFGEYYFAYIPDKNIIGLSKVARVIDFCAAKLQVQERLTKEVLDMIEKELAPIGCALILKGRHLCKEMRGVKKVNGQMTTSDMRGAFKDKKETRSEFLALIK